MERKPWSSEARTCGFYIAAPLFSRRWKRDQHKSEMSRPYSRPFLVGSLPPPPSYKGAGWPPPPAQPSPAYPRPPSSNMGWAHHMDNQNIYAVRANVKIFNSNLHVNIYSRTDRLLFLFEHQCEEKVSKVTGPNVKSFKFFLMQKML